MAYAASRPIFFKAAARRRRFRRGLAALALTLGLVAALPLPARAADATDVVNDVLTNALGTLGDKQMTERERNEQFRHVLDGNFDVPRIAHFVLGSYWESASEEDRQTFIRLFEQWLVESYTDSFKHYDGESVKVVGARQGGPNVTIVASKVVDRAGATGAELDWILHRQDETFKIININIEGMSFAMIERDQILAVIKRSGGTVTAANDALREKLGDEHP